MFSLATFSLGISAEAPRGSDAAKTAGGNFFACLAACLVLVFVGLFSAKHADIQNAGLASRNTKHFKSQGFKVLSAYGHKVCVAAGPHKLCLQQRKDATGTKQLVMQKADGSWFVVHGPAGGFMDALSHAPSD